ncbi:MAG: molybdate ABC transporter substrate-binding protein [Synergistaceae bacterium]
MIASKAFKFTVLLPLLLILSLFPATQPANAETELTVFAAASMTESMNMIADAYKKSEPDVKIIFNFDSSGTLKTQIEQGADCDIFISAGQKQMDQLDISADPSVNTKKFDFIMSGTRFNIVSNKVVLITHKNSSSKGIRGFQDLVTEKVSLVSIGNSDVPAGQYAAEVLKALDIWDKLTATNKISYASNVKEVLSQVSTGAVDCGFVYSTDAATCKAVEVIAEAPKGSHRPIIYPAALLKGTRNEKAASEFAKFLKGPESAGIFEMVGFTIPQHDK